MQLLTDLLPDPDTIESLIEESMPWLHAYFFVLVLVLIAFGVSFLVSKVRNRSVVEKLVRGRRVGV